MAKRPSLSESVAKEIEELIKTEQYQPEDQLPSEFELAESLEVGRGTIREAIKLLAARNVVEIKRGKGTFVTETPGLTEDPLGLAYISDKHQLSKDLMEVRLMIEPKVAELAAQRATSEDIQRLTQLSQEIETLIKADEDHTQKDIEFHEAIAKASGNLVVPLLLPVIQSGVSLFVNLTDRSLKTETIETHRGILEGIKNHDPVLARNQMLQHLQYNKEKLHI
ncbi:FadR/GntR family transcriptional regulator [Vagococcus humatus]|uniref:FadR family transcriptional regulator n=1 Tax=Vagococcus humatus TaxID=1889241 RepID=A0A3S0ADT2_9ENTE|nr:FadR/GntR family transcriptional regulator [Vagococcus humatus]RST90415.1 FadR family transcriptional regulator [Vagococcus humatus]